MSELRLLIRRSTLNGGRVEVPPSKSYTHRALVAAALSKGKTIIQNPLGSEDTQATIDALEKVGAVIRQEEDRIQVNGTSTLTRTVSAVLDCGESGTTLRFLIPLCALQEMEITLSGKAGLLKRPTREIVHALQAAGVPIIKDNAGFPPVRVRGRLKGGKIKIRGDVSSQFISGLLFALPLAEKDSELEVTGGIESIPYIRMTREVLNAFGMEVDASPDGRHYRIAGKQSYRSPGVYMVEGDYSSAAFLIAAGTLAGPEITLKGLQEDSIQGDSAIISIMKRMGADIAVQDENVLVKKSTLKATTIDAGDIPDLVPILAVIATQARGKTRITNAGRLRIKESDRLAAISTELKKMGASIRERADTLEITGPTPLHGAVIDPHNDHRIAMACTIAGMVAEGETVLENPEVVKKSYPDFFYHLRGLGATVLSETGSIGEKFRVQLYGGSHEKIIGVRIQGIPIGTVLSLDAVRDDLDKRRPFGNLTTPRREKDVFSRVEGIQQDGKVVAEEVVFEIENRDVDSRPYERMRFTPRPNHGDYTTQIKYGGVFDFRGGGFLSARMMTCTVIAGSIAKQILAEKGIRFAAYVKQIGKTRMEKTPSLEEALQNTYASEVRCPDPHASEAMKAAIEKARSEQDSMGGIIECQVHGLPVGIGEPIFHAVDSVLAHYLLSVPAVKGVEFGAGFEAASRKGSENNDAFEMRGSRITTATNYSGGIQGGITNGMPLILRVAIKPTSSIAREQQTVDTRTMQPASLCVLGRHDPCVAIRAPIIVETMAAIALMDLMLRC